MAKLNGPRFWFVTPEPRSGQVYGFSFFIELGRPWIHLSDLDLRLNSPRALTAIRFRCAVRVKRQPVVKFCSHHVTLPRKMNFPDFASIGRSRAKSGELDPWQLLCDSSLLY